MKDLGRIEGYMKTFQHLDEYLERMRDTGDELRDRRSNKDQDQNPEEISERLSKFFHSSNQLSESQKVIN
jgi:hypothetical protein